jgi:hypothetical protein
MRGNRCFFLSACHLQALLLGKPGGQCGEVPNARHWTFAELEGQVGEWRHGFAGGQKKCLPQEVHTIHVCLPAYMPMRCS